MCENMHKNSRNVLLKLLLLRPIRRDTQERRKESSITVSRTRKLHRKEINCFVHNNLLDVGSMKKLQRSKIDN